MGRGDVTAEQEPEIAGGVLTGKLSHNAGTGNRKRINHQDKDRTWCRQTVFRNRTGAEQSLDEGLIEQSLVEQDLDKRERDQGLGQR